MNNIVIYARVSSTGERQNTARQVLELEEYAKTNSMVVVKVFEEHMSGAKKNDERKILLECLEYCLKNNTSLCVTELSRIGRSVYEVQKTIAWCHENHVNIYFHQEHLCLFNDDGTENPFLPIIISVLATGAQMEREYIHSRMESGLKAYKEKGGKMGRSVGYRKSAEEYKKKYPSVCRMLRKETNLSYRQIAKLCGVSAPTVAKIKSVCV